MDFERYSRQMLVHGAPAQQALGCASVLVVGAGALGCACLPYLVGAGVGRVTIVDGDVVERSNLHRQPLHTEAGAFAGTNKAVSAAARLRELNSSVEIVAVPRHAAYDDETQRLVDAHDIVADCSDNVGTRYLLNDACVVSSQDPTRRTTLVAAAALGEEGSLARWGEAGTACYRCAFPRPSAFEARRRCADRGVLGPVPGAMGALQALDVLRSLSGRGRAPAVRVFDGETLRAFQPPPRRASCEVCGDAPSLNSLKDTKAWCGQQGVGERLLAYAGKTTLRLGLS